MSGAEAFVAREDLSQSLGLLSSLFIPMWFFVQLTISFPPARQPASPPIALPGESIKELTKHYQAI